MKGKSHLNPGHLGQNWAAGNAAATGANHTLSRLRRQKREQKRQTAIVWRFCCGFQKLNFYFIVT